MQARHRAATNQPEPLIGHDVIMCDAALVDAVRRFGDVTELDDSSSVLESLKSLGQLAGTAEAREHGMLANVNAPELTTFDRYGHRIDEVRFHSSWHWLMTQGVSFGLAATAWTSDEPHAHLRRAAGFFAWSQVESGHGCPLSMTYAAVPALQADAAIAREWTPRLASTTYDFGLRAPGDKDGCLAGMGMTEKQGGSDVRANVTTAHRSPTTATR